MVREFTLEFFSTYRMSDTEIGLDVADTLSFYLSEARCRMTWRQFILALGLHITEEMEKDGFEAYCARAILDKGDLFLVEDRHLRRGERVELGCLGDTSFGCLAAHFGLVSDEGLMGLTIISRKPSLIDMDKLVKLNICARLSDTWAWVASGPESTHVGTLATPAASLTNTIAQRLSRLEEEVYSLCGDMGPCCKEIDELVTVYSGKRRVLNPYGHSDASSTHFCSSTQIGESSRAKYQGSFSF
nr:hypothetical protein [Tanacetum cinerariifolium]